MKSLKRSYHNLLFQVLFCTFKIALISNFKWSITFKFTKLRVGNLLVSYIHCCYFQEVLVDMATYIVKAMELTLQHLALPCSTMA